ncbi:MAG: class II aldolase/adducin family protein [Oscillospiraceae bacterium]|nr:class II aldolase/adducin family protein [Oscillospiraceae bacterium]
MEQTQQAKREQIVRCFRKLYEQGTINLFEGNFSARWGENVLMTPSQQNKETMTPDMLVVLDAEGNLLSSNGLQPSSEARMHLEIYRLRPDLGAVVHTHSVCASAFALAGIPIRSELAELHLFYGGEIPCCAYGAPGTDAVFAQFERYFLREQRDVVLLANHGLVAAGRDVEEAFARAEAVEKLAKTAILARVLGGECPLPEGAAAELIEKWNNGRDRGRRN